MDGMLEGKDKLREAVERLVARQEGAGGQQAAASLPFARGYSGCVSRRRS